MGRGGTIARTDALPETVKLAQQLAAGRPSAAWETVFPEEAADFIHFIDAQRVLIGTVEIGAYLGIPDFKKVVLYDSRNGAKLWEADRQKLARGRYSVLAVQPAVVLLGSNATSMVVTGLDPASGAHLWGATFGSPLAHVLATNLGRVFVLASDGARSRVVALDLKTGSKVWTRELPAGVVTELRRPILQADDESVYVVGGKLLRLAHDGAIHWSADVAELAGREGTAAPVPGGALVWSGTSIALLEKASGHARWRHTVTRGGIKLATFRDESVFQVVSGGGADRIESIDPRSGNLQWTRELGGAVVSQLAVEQGMLLFSLGRDVVGLQARSGAPVFRNRLPLSFFASSPARYDPSGQPDLIATRNGRLFVSRESAGVIAYALPRGKELWRQDIYLSTPTAYPFSLPSRVQRMKMTLLLNNIQNASAAGGTPYLFAGVPNVNMQYSQWRYDNLESVRQSALATGDSQRADFAAGLQGAELRMQAFDQQMALSQQILASSVALSGAIRTALKEAALEGAMSKIGMEIDNTTRLHYAAFQGRYYVRPFLDPLKDKMQGVTLVDLDSGRRSDVVLSPFIEAVSQFGVEMPQVTLDPAGERLITVGVGLRPERYQPYVAWKVRLPRPSVLAYDIAALPFAEKNPHVERSAGDANAAPYRELLGEAAKLGDANEVRALVEAGVDINALHPRTSVTPLMTVIENNNESLARLLLELGADVNFVALRMTALDVAKSAETRQLLRKAGAKKVAEMDPNEGQLGQMARQRREMIAKNARESDPRLLAVWAELGNSELMSAMLDAGVSPDQRSGIGETPLMAAAKSARLNEIEILLKRGADVNAVSPKGETALDLAKDEVTKTRLRDAGGRSGNQLGKR